MRAVRFLVSLALLMMAPMSALAQSEPERWSVIHCGRLLATPGQPPLVEATVVIKGGRIAEVRRGYVEPAALPGAQGARIELIDLSRHFVLPGLIDCHTHITHELSADSRLRTVQESDADAALRGVMYARRTLDAGFTTIRNVGSAGRAGFALRDAINAGIVPGPRILEAGSSITPTGGHGDRTHGFRDDLFDVPTAMQGIADGADECRRAVRSQVKRGADVIKLTATGGVLSATDAGTDQQFFEDELKAIVETAHQLGRKVAAHAHGVRGINAALRAGVDSIEHGSHIDEESIRLFRETRAFLVPTLLAGRTVADYAGEDGYFMPSVRAKAQAIGPIMLDAFRRAHQGGVRIAFGTDSGVSRHGENAREFALMVEGGMTPMQAIVAATVNAAELCGLAGEVGTIEADRHADIIATLADPLSDVTELERVVFVMRGGVTHKRP